MAAFAVVVIHIYKKVYLFTFVRVFSEPEIIGIFLLEIGIYCGIIVLDITHLHGCTSKSRL